jgi:hypothetical protein
MPRGDAKQRQCGAIGRTAILLPVAERMHTNAERLRELRLREADELPKRRDVAGMKLAADDPLALAAPQRAA